MHRIRRILLVALVATAALRCTVALARAFREARTPPPPEEIQGLTQTVAWLRLHSRGPVFGCQHDEWPLLHQRLTEMLYPIPFQARPGPGTPLPANARLVLPAWLPAPPGYHPTQTIGDLRILAPDSKPPESQP